jgi:hypothetical protein
LPAHRADAASTAAAITTNGGSNAVDAA